MADEHDIASVIISICKAQKGGLCTYTRAYREIPLNTHLTPANLAPSQKRGGEPMWHQLVRNIKSHGNTPGNAVYDGRLIHIPRIGFKTP
jgi:hypothetical protein